MKLTLSHQIKTKINEEIKNGEFNDIEVHYFLAVHFERKRILALVDEAIEEDNYSPLTKQDFVDWKKDLKARILFK